MYKYEFAISDNVGKDWLGRKVHQLVYNPAGKTPLYDQGLPKWLDRQLMALGWSENTEAYCSREDDGTSKADLIAKIEATIPAMTYNKNLERYITI